MGDDAWVGVEHGVQAYGNDAHGGQGGDDAVTRREVDYGGDGVRYGHVG